MLGTEFLPISPEEVKSRGWDRPDFVYVTGDAYVDHPSFGVAIISRVLEAAGYRVAGNGGNGQYFDPAGKQSFSGTHGDSGEGYGQGENLGRLHL